ncbi:MAG: hypothetical protein ACOCWR_01100 [Oceanidesulfovibrio sp.]
MVHSRLVLATLLAFGFFATAGHWAAAALPGEHLLQERQLCDAQDMLHEMAAAMSSLNAGFHATPEQLHDRAWVRSALAHMAMVDEMARDALFASLEKSWEPEVFKTYVHYFINPRPAGDDDLAYLQRLDREHYALLKRVLTESSALGEAGWPTFDAISSYQAFIIARRGHHFDSQWQETTLLPRLKKLAAEGAIPAPAVAWLTAASPEELASVVAELTRVGPPWSNLLKQAERTAQLLNALRITAGAEMLPPLTPARCGPRAIMVEPGYDVVNGTRAGNATTP